MSEPEKPLHVRVAEALGWTDFRQIHKHRVEDGLGCPVGCRIYAVGRPPGPSLSPLEPEPFNPTFHWQAFRVPRYDTDWSATGPLIERFGISLSYGYHGWRASAHDIERDNGQAMPLVAVCNLILALAAAGELRTQKQGTT